MVIHKARISRRITHLLLQIIEGDHIVNTAEDQDILKQNVISCMDIHRIITDLKDLNLMDSKAIINFRDNNNMKILVLISHIETITKGKV